MNYYASMDHFDLRMFCQQNKNTIKAGVGGQELRKSSGRR